MNLRALDERVPDIQTLLRSARNECSY